MRFTLPSAVAAAASLWIAPAAADTTDAVWTPSADAPQGLLTGLEAQRHDFFIELARSASSCPGGAPLRETCVPGGIDVVFFGQTFSEIWWWPDRGMPVGEQAFGARKAVNFGSQGTRPESLLWRMRHGELDGYRAKLVVLQTLEPNPGVNPAIDAGYAALIAEIRARQPQAKILVFNIPRAGQQVAEVNARAGAAIVEDGTVFYIGLNEQLVPGREGYEAWAAELEPWLERFAG